MNAANDLPAPDPAFRWSDESWGAALRCRPLEAVAQHLFTTRQLELRGADQARGWELAAASLNADVSQLIRVTQVHGRLVHLVSQRHAEPREHGERPEADAIASDLAGAVLAVQVADCVPLLMADPRSGAVAAVHAGWRGMAARVARAAVEVMSRRFGTNPADLVVAIGPCIGPCCYQVGAELIDAFRAQGADEPDLGRWFSRADDSSWYLDLWRVSADQLVAAGVMPPHIHLSGLCTKTHAHIFDSYRAHGPTAGRLAALIRTPGV